MAAPDKSALSSNGGTIALLFDWLIEDVLVLEISAMYRKLTTDNKPMRTACAKPKQDSTGKLRSDPTTTALLSDPLGTTKHAWDGVVANRSRHNTCAIPCTSTLLIQNVTCQDPHL